MGKNSLLLQPLKVGNLVLKNRIMFPPLTTGYEERDGSIGERSLNFYERLAKGGASYVVIGDVGPVRTASPTPKLFEKDHVPAFKRLADTMHRYDCKVGLQIFHPEYDVVSVGKLINASRSAAMEAEIAKNKGDMETYQAKKEESSRIGKESYVKIHYDMQHFISEASVEQLDEIKSSIVNSAKLAVLAGIDAIEIHGDRLLGSLCSVILNYREDEYGGCFENRTRYALEVVEAIKVNAPELMIEYKLPVITINEDGSSRGKGGLYEEEAIEFAKCLEKAGVDMIQVAQANHTGNMGDTIPYMGTVAYNWTLPVAKKVKEVVSIPVATVGRVITVENGENILKNAEADMIAYGRSLLCDPDIALKIERDEPIRECLNCNKGCVDAIQSRKYISCVLNAENGDEAEIYIKPAEKTKKVVIIGSGLAGLEAARVAALRGYQVDIYEKESQIGGQIHLAAVPPRKGEIKRSIAYFEKILPTLNVAIHMNTECTEEIMNKADAVIVATGAKNVMPQIEGVESENVLSSWDVLGGKKDVCGHCVIIGGGLVGTETAEYILEKGCTVTIVEMLDKIASGESSTILPTIMESFKCKNVESYVNTRVDCIENDGKTVLATDIKEDKKISIDCDKIITAVGSAKTLPDLHGVNVPIYYVGDCAGEKTSNIADVIRSGYKVANEI